MGSPSTQACSNLEGPQAQALGCPPALQAPDCSAQVAISGLWESPVQH